MAKPDKIPSSDWLQVDPEKLPANVKKLYEAKQAADQNARKARDAFELAFSEALIAKGKLEKDRNARCGYNFGKLAVADPSKHSTPREKSGGSRNFAL